MDVNELNPALSVLAPHFYSFARWSARNSSGLYITSDDQVLVAKIAVGSLLGIPSKANFTLEADIESQTGGNLQLNVNTTCCSMPSPDEELSDERTRSWQRAQLRIALNLREDIVVFQARDGLVAFPRLQIQPVLKGVLNQMLCYAGKHWLAGLGLRVEGSQIFDLKIMVTLPHKNPLWSLHGAPRGGLFHLTRYCPDKMASSTGGVFHRLISRRGLEGPTTEAAYADGQWVARLRPTHPNWEFDWGGNIQEFRCILPAPSA